jgi:hypothetical protein
MLETKSEVRKIAATGGFDVEVLSVATANLPFVLTQTEAAKRARGIFPHLKGVAALR